MKPAMILEICKGIIILVYMEHKWPYTRRSGQARVKRIVYMQEQEQSQNQEQTLVEAKN